MTIGLGKKEGRELALIIAVSLPFIFWGIGSVSLLDPDEGLYGSTAREMAEQRDWITPHFNGLRYLEKPPLYFWLTALTFALFEPSEWATRLWSAVPTLGTAVLTWRIGGLLYGGLAGALSAVVLVTNAAVFRYTRVAATDWLLVFSLTLAIYGFVKTVLSQSSIVNGQRSGPMLFYLGMALGVLSKGLIGVVFPLFIAGLYLLAIGKWQMANGGGRGPFAIGYSLLANRAGLVLFLGLTVPWHLLAGWRNPGFFQFYIVDNQLLRFLSNRAFIEDDVPVTTFAFLALTFVWFFPWSLFLSATLRQGFPDRHSVSLPQEKLRLLVGLWALAVMGFFSLSSSTLEHYMLPALPPLSLMVGALWAEAVSASRPLPSLKWLLVASAVGCGLAGVALILWANRLTSDGVFSWLAEMNVYYRILKDQGVAFPFPSVAPFVPLAKGVGAALAIGLPLALIFFLLRKPLASFVAVAGAAAGVAFMILKLLVIIEPHHSAKPVALALKAQAQQGELIVHEGSLEYSGSLPFYTGRQIHVLNGRRGDLDFGSRYPEGQGLFLDDKDFARLWEGGKRVFLVTRQESVLRELAGQPFFLLGRYGSRLLYSNHGP